MPHGINLLFISVFLGSIIENIALHKLSRGDAMEQEILARVPLIQLSSEEQKELEVNIAIGVFKQLHNDKLLTDSQLDRLILMAGAQRRC